MRESIRIPRAIQRELAEPAGPGARHQQGVRIAAALAAQGFHGGAIFAQLRGMYPGDVSDRELHGIVQWAENNGLGRGRSDWRRSSRLPRQSWSPGRSPQLSPAERIRSFVQKSNVAGLDYNALQAEVWEASPWRPPDDRRLDAAMLIAGLYEKDDQINIVSVCDPDGKPAGYGQTLSRDQWLAKLREARPPQCGAGVWIRMNPTDGRGIADANITRCRFALLELDCVPLHLQLALFCKLPLPIAALITSGGRSIHAWVRIEAANPQVYGETVSRMFELLKPFGCDTANKNPGRLSRLPGVVRSSSDAPDDRQRLLYFAPDRDDNKPLL